MLDLRELQPRLCRHLPLGNRHTSEDGGDFAFAAESSQLHVLIFLDPKPWPLQLQRHWPSCNKRSHLQLHEKSRPHHSFQGSHRPMWNEGAWEKNPPEKHHSPFLPPSQEQSLQPRSFTQRAYCYTVEFHHEKTTQILGGAHDSTVFQLYFRGLLLGT